MANNEIPHFQLSGSQEEVAYSYGVQARTLIRDCYNFYTKELIPISSEKCEAYGDQYLACIKQTLPSIGQELEALAEGAQMAAWKIALINARTEIYLQECKRIPVECTSTYFPKTALLGQNWDWMKSCKSFSVVLDISYDNKHRILTMVEAGMLGKIGINNQGIGVSLNILRGEPNSIGVPIHILLKYCLDQPSIHEALKSINTLPTDTFSNILLADNTGDYHNIEFWGNEVRSIEYTSPCPVHTNHFLSENYTSKEKKEYESSMTRLNRAQELCESLSDFSLNEIKMLLADNKNEKFSICSEFSPYKAVELACEMEVGTIYSFLMNLKTQEMWITQDSPQKKDYKLYCFKT